MYALVWNKDADALWYRGAGYGRMKDKEGITGTGRKRCKAEAKATMRSDSPAHRFVEVTHRFDSWASFWWPRSRSDLLKFVQHNSLIA